MSRTNDTRVVSYQPLVAPHDLLAELPMGPERTALVEEARAEVKKYSMGRTTGCWLSWDRAPCTTPSPPWTMHAVSRR